jgi:hypothetical protein
VPDPYDFAVSRNDLRSTVTLPLAEESVIAPGPGEAVLRIDGFAMTANNVTYAAMGDAMNYWDFFPATEGLGRVPAWGYAEVVASDADGVGVGQRVYGFLPMSTHLVVEPGDVTDTGFIDAAPHRSGLPAVYNRYGFASPADGDPDRGPMVALFSPLFTTSFLIADWLKGEGFAGAARVLVSSASSKTALGLAWMLSEADGADGADVERIGLTSEPNLSFVDGTGLYDSVVAYDRIDSIPADEPLLYLDFSGNADLRTAVHSRFSESLASSTTIGAADWEGLMPSGDGVTLAGPDPGFFFAPSHVARRSADWGADELRRRVGEYLDRFIDEAGTWLRIRRASGPEAIDSTWRLLLDGAVDPADGWYVAP